MERCDLLVVSDLHLSGGWNGSTGRYSPHEDFFYDEDFDRFLAYFEVQAEASGVKWKLIINGDMIDFLQIITDCRGREIPPGIELTPVEMECGPGTSPLKSIWKLDTMMEGHPLFFSALSRFLANGHKLVIIKGNHDLELFWPEVQEHFKKRLGSPKNIEFLPWFYYEKGNIYVEHGSQYEKTSSIHNFLHPLLPPSLTPPGDELLELPFGIFFMRYFFNKTEAIYPFADNIKPTTRYISWVLKNHFFSVWKIIHKYAPLHFKVLSKIKKFPQDEEEVIRKAHNDELAKLEEKFGLCGVLQKIDALRETPVTSSKGVFIKFILKDVLFRVSLASLFALAIFYGVVLGAVTLGKLDAAAPFTTFYLTLMCLVISTFAFSLVAYIRLRIERTAGEFALMRTRAREIAELLDVKTVVFGHTHNPDIWRMPDSDRFYFNTSTWVPVVSEEPSLFIDNKQFVFLKVENGEAKLFKWNDQAGRAETVKLMEEMNS